MHDDKEYTTKQKQRIFLMVFDEKLAEHFVHQAKCQLAIFPLMHAAWGMIAVFNIAFQTKSSKPK